MSSIVFLFFFNVHFPLSTKRMTIEDQVEHLLIETDLIQKPFEALSVFWPIGVDHNGKEILNLEHFDLNSLILFYGSLFHSFLYKRIIHWNKLDRNSFDHNMLFLGTIPF